MHLKTLVGSPHTFSQAIFPPVRSKSMGQLSIHRRLARLVPTRLWSAARTSFRPFGMQSTQTTYVCHHQAHGILCRCTPLTYAAFYTTAKFNTVFLPYVLPSVNPFVLNGALMGTALDAHGGVLCDT